MRQARSFDLRPVHSHAHFRPSGRHVQLHITYFSGCFLLRLVFDSFVPDASRALALFAFVRLGCSSSAGLSRSTPGSTVSRGSLTLPISVRSDGRSPGRKLSGRFRPFSGNIRETGADRAKLPVRTRNHMNGDNLSRLFGPLPPLQQLRPARRLHRLQTSL